MDREVWQATVHGVVESDMTEKPSMKHDSKLFLMLIHFIYLFIFFIFSILIKKNYTCVPHPEPSSLLPPHTIPLGRPSAPAPSIQHRALNLDWHLISYMTFHMFQCHSPKSSHPLPLPQSP